MTRREHELKLARLKAAMSSLVQNPNFVEFMGTLTDLREGAIAYAVSHTTVRDQRETLAALGEVRCYDDILDVYRSHLEPEPTEAKAETR